MDRRTQRTRPASAWAIPLGVAVGVVLSASSAFVAAAFAGRRAVPFAPVQPVPVSSPAKPSNLASVAAAISEPGTTPAPTVTAEAFDAKRAFAQLKKIVSFGPRQSGSTAEDQAVAYVRGEFEALGYATTVENVPLPGGKTTHNVVALKPGGGAGLMVVGGHIDSKLPSPGANDDASGIGVILELARVMRDRGTGPSIEFVAFGGEETVDADPDHHHYGSRAHAFTLRTTRPDEKIAMIAVDMVGAGSFFAVRSMGKGPLRLAWALRARAGARKVTLRYLKDKASSGSADHEAFELAGMPAAWLSWRTDPTYHTKRDTPDHISVPHLATVGTLLLDFLTRVTSDDVARWYAK